MRENVQELFSVAAQTSADGDAVERNMHNELARQCWDITDRKQAIALHRLYTSIDRTSLTLDDDRWQIIFALKKGPVSEQEDGKKYAVVHSVAGFATVYGFYSYPESTRLRLSQCLVMPPYEKRGFGSAIVRGVYQLAERQLPRFDERAETGCATEQLGYVTVEDPTDYLQLLMVKQTETV